MQIPTILSMELLQRLGSGSLLGPGTVPGYGPIFNPGVVHHDGRFHLFARGVRQGYRRNRGRGPRFRNYVSDVLVFESTEGVDYRFQKVLAAGGDGDAYAYEDPRVQWLWSGGRRHLVMTYTHLLEPSRGLPWRIGLHRLEYRDGEFELVAGSGAVVGPEGREDKDGVVFNLRDGRVALIHRLYPDMQLAVFESLEELVAGDRGYWEEHLKGLDDHVIIRPAEDAFQVGAGAPPVPTEEGLLLFFHQRSRRGVYTMEVALLDEDTGRVKARLPRPLLSPQTSWERTGDVDQVIFVQGAHRMDEGEGTIYLTYGAADRCVGAALVSERLLLEALLS